MAKASNSYTHPDVYLDISKIGNNKEEMLINLIKMNVYLISESYNLFIKGVNAYGASTNLLNNNVTAWRHINNYMLHAFFSTFFSEVSARQISETYCNS